MKLLIAAGILSLCISGCTKSTPEASGSEPPPVSLVPMNFEGFVLPGNAETAKAAGFSQCEDNYSSFQCTAVKNITVVGVTAQSATVELNPADAYADRPYSKATNKIIDADLSKLSYRSISFQIPNTKYDERCVEKYQKKTGEWIEPDHCKIPGGKDTFRDKLSASGWYEGSARRGWTYYKVDFPFRIFVSSKDFEGVVIERLSSAESKELWAQHAKEAAEKQEAAKKSQAFIESMKTN